MSKGQQARTASGKAVRACARRSSGAAGAALALWLLAFASPALAGPPTHLHEPPLDITGFDHACGAAVDSEGDVYVAGAGEAEIRIFDPVHTELTSISNANEPCGLAVDGKGNLYVSERATGKVVRYVPNAYPFSGAPIYGAPVTIDSSGEAEGISVDPFDDRLYVAKGSRIDTYDSEGRLGIDEAQRVLVFEATGGTFKLIFKGQETGPIAWDASHVEVQAALEALTTIGVGNASVTQGPNAGNPQDHLVTFKGALGHTDVEALTADTSNLTGGSNLLIIQEVTKGFSGHIGEGDLSEATGVAAYTYKVGSEKADRYVFAADAATDQVKIFGSSNIRTLKLRRTIDGPKPEEDFGFGPAGAYLAVDPGNRNAAGKCSSIDEQACTAGHLLVYDDAHEAVDEFEANGEFLAQFTDEGFADAEPTAIAVDRSGGSGDGTIYVTSGAGPGAKLLAFGPLTAPSRPPLPELSHVLAAARAVATDSEGNVYVAAGPLVHVYGPDGEEIEVGPAGTGIETETAPFDLAVDSTCKVYMLFRTGNEPEQEKVQYYTPSSCPSDDGTQYSGPVTVADGNSFPEPPTIVTAIGINPANDRIFVTSSNPARVIELGSAAEGSPILNSCFACGLSLENVEDVGVYGASGNVYISQFNNGIWVVDQSGTEVLARIGGGGSLKGQFVGPTGAIAVDQSNGHVLAFHNPRGAAEEYDASGSFVTEFAFPEPEGFSTGIVRDYRIAIDNSGGPADGSAYVVFDDTKANTPDLWAFGPLSYGEPPLATTGIASGLGAGNATLHGSVDPRGFELEDCHFEHLADAAYQENVEDEKAPFEGAEETPCSESLEEIGKGTGPVAVHAEISGLDPDARYRFRLFAKSKYGASEGKAGLFGPPLLTIKTALPILYEEATLRAVIDPSGLATKYHFEYGTSGAYGQSTPVAELPPGDGGVAIEVPLTGLAEGTEYHFRIVVENEAKTVEGPDQTLETRERAAAQECPNTEFRTGLSTNLPDCRAYELVTPAETRGATPSADPGTGTAGQEFNNWLVAPRGEGAGESIAYFVRTLPGFEGTGKNDAYRAQRVAGEGLHPKEGWVNELFGPSYTQAGGETQQHGIASDQRYGLFDLLGITATLDTGKYLRTPAGLEPVGMGSLGVDLEAEGRFLSAGAAHVIFSSPKHLEPEAAPEGTVAIYDRVAGASSAEVVSVKPGGPPFLAGEKADYVAAGEDGSAVVFKVGETLYLHRAGGTVEVAAAPSAFAGISEDGTRLFYAEGDGTKPNALFACDVEAGPCVGAEPSGRTEIAQDSIFVNVSPDGSRVYFTSEEALAGGEENEAGEAAEAGEHNLYTWDGTGIRFVAILAPEDFESFDGFTFMNLLRWTRGVSAGVEIGRDNSPTRSTPDGRVLVFQSHVQLTSYDNEGHGEIYRYEPGATPGGQLICVSCDPTGAPASADALLQINSFGGVTRGTTLIPNVTDDGEAILFQSPDRLLPEDANGVEDVYEWKTQGEGCELPDGCLALISSGQGKAPSYLYGMSADGRDVFFVTTEKLVGADVPGSPSMYDAREGGGIPEPAAPSPCQGDACQGRGSAPPALPPPARTGGAGGGNVKEGRPKLRCPKGKRKVRSKGRTRCVNKHRKKRAAR